MKRLLICSLSIGLFLTSCTTTQYYQLYKATGTSQLQSQNTGMVYDDSSCTVTYDLWSEGGDAGFKFYNKTNENIYLNMEDSFFILNGVAYNYFGSRIVTKGSGKTLATNKKSSFMVSPITTHNYLVSPLLTIGNASSVGLSSSTSESVSYAEEKLIVIPPKSAKFISEYNIISESIRNCELLRYPSKKQIKPVSFSSESSPVNFSNRISYRVGTGSTLKFENNFYISEVTNYPTGEFFETKKSEDCEGKSKSSKQYRFRDSSSFYRIYYKNSDQAKY